MLDDLKTLMERGRNHLQQSHLNHHSTISLGVEYFGDLLAAFDGTLAEIRDASNYGCRQCWDVFGITSGIVGAVRVAPDPREGSS